MLNSGGIKLSTCQSLTSKLRGCVDAVPGGIPHAARFIEPRIEHQRDSQKNMTQQWNGQEIPSFPVPPPGVVKTHLDLAIALGIEAAEAGLR